MSKGKAFTVSIFKYDIVTEMQMYGISCVISIAVENFLTQDLLVSGEFRDEKEEYISHSSSCFVQTESS